MSKSQVVRLFETLHAQIERSAAPLVKDSRHLKSYVQAQQTAALEVASNAQQVKAYYQRAQDALRLREHAQLAHELRIKYLGTKLPKHELIRRTAGHVGLGLPRTPAERAADLRDAMKSAADALAEVHERNLQQQQDAASPGPAAQEATRANE